MTMHVTTIEIEQFPNCVLNLELRTKFFCYIEWYNFGKTYFIENFTFSLFNHSLLSPSAFIISQFSENMNREKKSHSDFALHLAICLN